MLTIKDLEPSNIEIAFDRRLQLRRDFGSFQHRQQPHRLPEVSRNYLAGDPVRLIDWRAYARTNQLLVNQTRQTANCRVKITVSCTPAMCWPVDGKIAKLEIALRIALHLAFAHCQNLDSVTLLLNDNSQLYRRQVQRRDEILELYSTIDDRYSCQQLVESFFVPADDPGPAEICYGLGDGFSSNCQNFFKQRTAHNISCFFHTLSSLELNNEWLDNNTTYYEGQHKLLGISLKENFVQQLHDWQQAIEDSCYQQSCHYLQVNEMTTIDSYLSFITQVSHFNANGLRVFD